MAKKVSELHVEGMSCNHCVMSIKRAVGTLKGVDSVEVDLEKKKVTTGYDPDQVTLELIKKTIEDQGYDVK